MNTVFLLMAEFNTPTIPLSQIAEKYLGMTISTANKKANCGELSIPSFRLDQGQKAPRIVHIQDLADYIDKQREIAKDELKEINS
ncbi:pyocin activator PrtN family protein [Gilliamella sp. B3486]|uniref:pyocin activator PrtN family protein n=1 Tax=unclassified Gilliamella TaxID=2685620 RepID=UPI00226A073F|nr:MULTISPECIES: pyocin activator PrtN family protein [unclassified Gilliamella]MCX8596763.1 pyocin activator PrtN family protein [Gilliamella sp. B3493]MCX8598491.1 pyocin activator PrtN family protein [Gilliamella sp. B3486]MCX8704478.1 pyocin activator PrtN family protein [Gilliamella sp. B3127]